MINLTIVKFSGQTFKERQGTVGGSYLSPYVNNVHGNCSNAGTTTVFLVKGDDGVLYHVPGFMITEIVAIPSDEINVCMDQPDYEPGQIKWFAVDLEKEVEKKGKQELYEETIRQYLEKETSLVTDAEGKKYLVFDLLDVSEENRKAYISDISREIVEYFE